MAELALLIMLFLESDIFLNEDCDVDDVIILSFDDKEFDIWDSCPESFLFSDDPDGIGISKDIWKIQYLLPYNNIDKIIIWIFWVFGKCSWYLQVTLASSWPQPSSQTGDSPT